MIRVHLKKEELEELGQVVVQMEGPHEIPHRVQSLKDEGNKCFNNDDFVEASGLCLYALNLFCFNCVITEVDEDMFSGLAINLNLNLVAS